MINNLSHPFLLNSYLINNSVILSSAVSASSQESQEKAICSLAANYSPILIFCKLLQEKGLLSEQFAFKQDTLEHFISSSEEILIKQQALLDSKLSFKFEQAGYAIEIPYRDLLRKILQIRELHGNALPLIRVTGSGAAKLIGAVWLKERIQEWTSFLPTSASLLSHIDKEHIEQEAEDIDTHIDLRQRFSFKDDYASIYIENEMIHLLMIEHYKVVRFELHFKDQTVAEVVNFEKLLYAYKNQVHLIDEITVCGPEVPWLTNNKISFKPLYKIFNQELNHCQGNVKQIEELIFSLAGEYLFKCPYEEMASFIQEQAFIYFHWVNKSIYNQPSLKNDWHRMTCNDLDGNTYDFVTMRKMPFTERVGFQKIAVDILPALQITNQARVVHLVASRQAILDKYCRLIRWENLLVANHTDWAYFWFLIAKGYQNVITDLPANLLTKFISFCHHRQDFELGFIETITGKLNKRLKQDATLSFAFVFNAMTSLPPQHFSKKSIANLWQGLKPYIILEKQPLPPILQILVTSLYGEKEKGQLEYTDIVTLLQTLAMRYLLINPTDLQQSEPPQDQQARVQVYFTLDKQLQIQIAGHTFLVPFDFSKNQLDFITMQEKLGQNKASKKSFSSVLEAFALSQRYVSNEYCPLFHYLKEDQQQQDSLLNSADQALATENDELFKQGYHWLLLSHQLKPTEDKLIQLFFSLPYLLHCEKEVKFRLEVVEQLKKISQEFFKTIPLDTIKLFFDDLQHLAKQPLIESKQTLLYKNLILSFAPLENSKLMPLIGNLWEFLILNETDKALKKLGFHLLKMAALSYDLKRKIYNTLQKKKLGNAEEWLEYIKFSNKNFSLLSFPIYYDWLKLIETFQRQFPEKKTEISTYFYRELEKLCVKNKVELMFSHLSSLNESLDSPFNRLGKLKENLQQFTFSHLEETEITKTVEELLPIIQQAKSPLSTIALTCLIEIGSHIKIKLPSLYRNTYKQQQLKLLIGSKQHAQAFRLLQKFLQQEGLKESHDLWLTYLNACLDRDLQKAVGAWKESESMLISHLKIVEEYQAFSYRFLEKLLVSSEESHLVLAQELQQLLPPSLPTAIINLINSKKNRQIKDRADKITLKTAKQELIQLLNFFKEETDDSCISSIKELIKLWIKKLSAADQTKKRHQQAVSLLNDPNFHQLYAVVPDEFISLCASGDKVTLLAADPAHHTLNLTLLPAFFKKIEHPKKNCQQLDQALFSFLTDLLHQPDLAQPHLFILFETLIHSNLYALSSWPAFLKFVNQGNFLDLKKQIVEHFSPLFLSYLNDRMSLSGQIEILKMSKTLYELKEQSLEETKNFLLHFEKSLLLETLANKNKGQDSYRLVSYLIPFKIEIMQTAQDFLSCCQTFKQLLMAQPRSLDSHFFIKLEELLILLITQADATWMEVSQNRVALEKIGQLFAALSKEGELFNLWHLIDFLILQRQPNLNRLAGQLTLDCIKGKKELINFQLEGRDESRKLKVTIKEVVFRLYHSPLEEDRQLVNRLLDQPAVKNSIDKETLTLPKRECIDYSHYLLDPQWGFNEQVTSHLKFLENVTLDYFIPFKSNETKSAEEVKIRKWLEDQKSEEESIEFSTSRILKTFYLHYIEYLLENFTVKPNNNNILLKLVDRTLRIESSENKFNFSIKGDDRYFFLKNLSNFTSHARGIDKLLMSYKWHHLLKTSCLSQKYLNNFLIFLNLSHHYPIDLDEQVPSFKDFLFSENFLSNHLTINEAGLLKQEAIEREFINEEIKINVNSIISKGSAQLDSIIFLIMETNQLILTTEDVRQTVEWLKNIIRNCYKNSNPEFIYVLNLYLINIHFIKENLKKINLDRKLIKPFFNEVVDFLVEISNEGRIESYLLNRPDLILDKLLSQLFCPNFFRQLEPQKKDSYLEFYRIVVLKHHFKKFVKFNDWQSLSFKEIKVRTADIDPILDLLKPVVIFVKKKKMHVSFFKLLLSLLNQLLPLAQKNYICREEDNYFSSIHYLAYLMHILCSSGSFISLPNQFLKIFEKLINSITDIELDIRSFEKYSPYIKEIFKSLQSANFEEKQKEQYVTILTRWIEQEVKIKKF